MKGKAPIPQALWRDLLRLTAERLTDLHGLHDNLTDLLKKYEQSQREAASAQLPSFSGSDFKRIGSAMFGEKWTGFMARSMRMSPEYMRKLAKGGRPIRWQLLLELEVACKTRISLMEMLEDRLFGMPFFDEVLRERIALMDEAPYGAVKSLIFQTTLH